MKLCLIAILFILSISPAMAKKCSVKGDLLRWQYAYCTILNEVDDCAAEAVTDCYLKIRKELGKKSSCDQKVELRKRYRKQCGADASCKKNPSIVTNGCG